MFFKPVECNASIFYGIFVSIGEIQSAMKRFKFKGDIYSFIYSNGIEYVSVGDNKLSQEFLIGKKIDFYHNFLAVKLKFGEDGMYLQHLDGQIPNIKMSDFEEVELKKKLFQMGFMNNLDYYMVHNYKSNRLE